MRGGPFEGFAIIYALTDDNDKIFYIGCTIQELGKRMKAHLVEAKMNMPYTNRLKNNKIRSLDYKIRIKELDRAFVSGRNKTCAQRSAMPIENIWIKKFSREGIDLCNRELVLYRD